MMSFNVVQNALLIIEQREGFCDDNAVDKNH